FIYGDLAELKFQPQIFETYRPAYTYYHSHEMPDGKQSLRYPMGVSFFFLPFFFLAHLFASISDLYLADGFSLPYQFAVSMAAIFYSVLGLFILRRVLLRFFDDGVAALTLALVAVGTIYLNYAAIDGGMTHTYLFTIYAAVIWLTIRWHEDPTWGRVVGIGLLIGWAGLTRPTDLLLGLVPLLWGISNRATWHQKLQLVKSKLPQLALAGLAMGLVGSLQLLYWKYTTGNFVFYSYGEIGFNFKNPLILQGLFSYCKGLFMFSPVLIFSLIGIYAHYRKQRESFWAIWIYLLVTWYVIFSWSIWWYGGGLGGRPLVQTISLMAIPLAAFLNWLWVQPRLLRWPLYGVMIVFVEINLNFHWQSHGGNNPYWNPDGLSKGYYLKVVGRTHFKKEDTKFYEVERELKDPANYQETLLVSQTYENDTSLNRSQTQVFGGTYSLLMAPSQEFSPKYETTLGAIDAESGDWIQVKVQFYFEQYPSTFWNYAQLTTMLLEGEQVYHATPARLHRLGEPGSWTEFSYEVRLPSQAKDEDLLRLYLWDPEPTTPLWIDNFEVRLYQK
ncbi:MAG: hypothetical protein AAF804_02750, partial [Bacteroidota bacterium]